MTTQAMTPGTAGQVKSLTELNKAAKVASNNKDHVQALTLYRQALAMDPQSQQVQMSLGWELYRYMGTLVPNSEQVNAGALYSALREYAKLNIEKPSLLHNLVLKVTCRASEKSTRFIDFVKWWDLNNLQPEDFKVQTNKNAGTEYQPLVHGLVKSLYLKVKFGHADENTTWILNVMTKLIETGKFTDWWFDYYLGVVAIAAGELALANKYLSKTLSMKGHESWVWNKLAETYGQDQLEIRIACLQKALKCASKDESKKSSMRLELACSARSHGCYSLAREQIAIIQQNVTNSSQTQLNNLIMEAWFVNGTADTTTIELQQSLNIAASLACADMETRNGVIIHVNSEKNISCVAFSKDEKDVALLKHDKFDGIQDLPAGTFVEVKVSSNKDSNKAHDFSITTAAPSTDFCKTVCGNVRINSGNSFGFVDDNFISPALVNSACLVNMQKVTATTVLKWNKKHQDFKWEVISVLESIANPANNCVNLH